MARSLDLVRFFSDYVRGGNPVPYDSIAMIDSRMWDPKFRARVGRNYNILQNIFGWALNNPNKGATLASGESYYWLREDRMRYKNTATGDAVGALRELGQLEVLNELAKFPDQLSTIIAGWMTSSYLQVSLNTVIRRWLAIRTSIVNAAARVINVAD